MNKINVTVNGMKVIVSAGQSVMVAIDKAQIVHYRTSVTGKPRAPLCGMGTCFECRVEINGESHMRACRIVCIEGMEIATP